MNKKVCCICGCEFEGWGNNPWPIVGSGNKKFTKEFIDSDQYTCCDSCNYFEVIPARIKSLKNKIDGLQN